MGPCPVSAAPEAKFHDGEYLDAGLTTRRHIIPESNRYIGIDGLEALVEARATAAYYGCWQDLPLYWKGTGLKSISEEW